MSNQVDKTLLIPNHTIVNNDYISFIKTFLKDNYSTILDYRLIKGKKKFKPEIKMEHKFNFFLKKEVYYLEVNIDFNSVVDYSKTNSISLENSYILIFNHEIFHFIMGHYDKKYAEYDQKLFHLAADLEINSLLKIEKPFKNPKEFYLPVDLNVEEYYTILKSMNINFEDVKNDEDQDSNTDGSESHHKIYSKEIVSMLDDLYDFNENENYFDYSSMLKNENANSFGNKVKNRLNYSKFLNKYKIDGLDKVIKSIAIRENQFRIVRSEKEKSWLKYNNRRKKINNLIFPGNVIVNGDIERKFDTSPIVFIDTSGSTGNITKDLFYLSKELQSKINATIITYNKNIVDIFGPLDYPIIASSGETNIYDVINQYKIIYNEIGMPDINRIYIFTDGDDEFSKVFKEYDARIYQIKENRIRQISNS